MQIYLLRNLTMQLEDRKTSIFEYTASCNSRLYSNTTLLECRLISLDKKGVKFNLFGK